ncbi:hypothetical protein ACNKHX_05510 [Shigella flexneri]
MGFVTVFLDLVLAPATPSNTARAGDRVTDHQAAWRWSLGSD